MPKSATRSKSPSKSPGKSPSKARSKSRSKSPSKSRSKSNPGKSASSKRQPIIHDYVTHPYMPTLSELKKYTQDYIIQYVEEFPKKADIDPAKIEVLSKDCEGRVEIFLTTTPSGNRRFTHKILTHRGLGEHISQFTRIFKHGDVVKMKTDVMDTIYLVNSKNKLQVAHNILPHLIVPSDFKYALEYPGRYPASKFEELLEY